MHSSRTISCCPCLFIMIWAVTVVVILWLVFWYISYDVHLMWSPPLYWLSLLLWYGGNCPHSPSSGFDFLFEDLDTSWRQCQVGSLAGAAHLSNEIGGAQRCTGKPQEEKGWTSIDTAIQCYLPVYNILSWFPQTLDVLGRITLVQFQTVTSGSQSINPGRTWPVYNSRSHMARL